MEGITKKVFGTTKNGVTVDSYILKNSKLEVEILTLGGVIRKILAPNKKGKLENVVLGFDTVAEYENNIPYFGCITGRVAGRIKKGKLKIADKIYDLDINNGENSLHGGINSLNTKVWNATTMEKSDGSLILTLSYVSPHLENNFPGEVKFTVTYTLKDDMLTIDYLGIPDRETYICLTNHTYFNLSGNSDNEIYNQKIKLNAGKFLEVDAGTMPTKISPVYGPFDLHSGKYFKDILLGNEEQIKIVGGGIDHGFILSANEKLGGRVEDENSGRVLTFSTDQPAVVLYTGNYLGDIGRKKHSGFCLETQDYPDVANILPSEFKTYDAKKVYTQKTTYKFSVKKI